MYTATGGEKKLLLGYCKILSKYFQTKFSPENNLGV